MRAAGPPPGPPCSWERAVAPCARREGGLGVAGPAQTPAASQVRAQGLTPGAGQAPSQLPLGAGKASRL